MLKEELNKYCVGMLSLGCPKNQVDAERMMFLLEERGLNLSTNIEDCDIIVINTCGFIADAKQESINEILKMVEIKLDECFKLKLIVVTGCLAQRYHDQLREQIPEIDVVVGVGGNKNIVDLIIEGLNNKKVTVIPPKNDMMMFGDRILTTPGHFAYLKIADGCNNRCAYCAIPMIKGNYISEPKEKILEEARKLAELGVKEINVVAQDVTCYGQDLYKKFALGELLRDLCKIDGIKWIRLLYCYPDKITDELIDVIASEEKIVKYIDIPLQHINDQVLSRMRRRGDKKLILDVISKLRERVKGIVIRSTFIVGFPGETKQQFEELLEFIKEIKLQKVGCFKYSKEEDTEAATFEDQIDEDEKERRQEMLLLAQDEVIDYYRESYEGKNLEILVEGFDEESGLYFGRSYMEAPEIDGYIEFQLPDNYQGKRPEIGDFVNVCL